MDFGDHPLNCDLESHRIRRDDDERYYSKVQLFESGTRCKRRCAATMDTYLWSPPFTLLHYTRQRDIVKINFHIEQWHLLPLTLPYENEALFMTLGTKCFRGMVLLL